MNIDYFTIIFFGIFAFVVGRFLIKIIQKGGFKAALFGASIEQSIGEVEGAHGKLFSIRIKVHRLKDESPEKAVGLELITKSITSYNMIPLTLSAGETRKLISLLEMSISGK